LARGGGFIGFILAGMLVFAALWATVLLVSDLIRGKGCQLA
jgi:hypothetical protein